jgi:asparagine synthase (glutamine-hydrolysing)
MGAMLKALRHRGPDGVGEWSDDRCALGQTRLAIIDLSDTGQAPLSNEDGTVWVTFNGEIYNFQEIRADLQARGHTFRSGTDTEVIVHAYEEWGTASVECFRGMFALALWDQKRQRLFLARDRVGKKPLFYARVNGDFYFASELQSILAIPSFSPEVDPAAIQSYLSWGYIPAPLTGFAGVQKLPPARWLTIELGAKGREEVQEYWSLPRLPTLDITEAEASVRLREILTEAVRLRLISDVPLGAFLSGGIDSSIVVGLMAQLSSAPVETFSIGFEDVEYNELHHARRIAERFGTEHHEHIVRADALDILPTLVKHFGEPFADSSAIPTYYVSQITRKFVTVALNGDGGDESFAGYDRYWGNALAGRVGRIPGLRLGAALAKAVPSSKGIRDPFRRAERFLSVAGQQEAHRYAVWMSYFTGDDKQRLCTPEFLNESTALSTPAWFEEVFSFSDANHPIDAAMHVDVHSYLPYDLLVKVDIASMASSLEGRSPFLDHEVMEFAARLPAKMKLRGRSGKHLLKETFADLLPPENVNRPKMGFGVPVGRWMRGPLRDLLCDGLLSDQARQRSYFQPKEVRRLVDEHLGERADHSAKLWNLLMLEMWHREVVEGVREPLAKH